MPRLPGPCGHDAPGPRPGDQPGVRGASDSAYRPARRRIRFGKLVQDNAEHRARGFLAEAGVNVLELDIAVDPRSTAAKEGWNFVARGELRIFSALAPGVGKSYTMLEEARRRAERGTDVVVAFVETHGGRRTAAMRADLEACGGALSPAGAAEFTEMDLDAVLAHRPELTVVDDLAHTHVPGSRHAKRFQDVQVLLDAGIDVLTTVNVHHLESLPHHRCAAA
jgi:hypothetical protein